MYALIGFQFQSGYDIDRATPILTNIHSSYAVIWTQVTTVGTHFCRRLTA